MKPSRRAARRLVDPTTGHEYDQVSSARQLVRASIAAKAGRVLVPREPGQPRGPREMRKGAALRDGRVVHPDLGDPVPTREEYDYTPSRSAGGSRPLWPTWLRRYILQRDAFTCPKCGFTGSEGEPGLSVHHKKEVISGGDDHPDNLITLCVQCHDEWTYCEPPPDFISFDAWLAIPPMRVMLALFCKPWPEEVSARSYQDTLLATYHNFRVARGSKPG